MPMLAELTSVIPRQIAAPGVPGALALGHQADDLAVLVDQVMRADLGRGIAQPSPRPPARSACRCNAAPTIETGSARSSQLGDRRLAVDEPAVHPPAGRQADAAAPRPSPAHRRSARTAPRRRGWRPAGGSSPPARCGWTVRRRRASRRAPGRSSGSKAMRGPAARTTISRRPPSRELGADLERAAAHQRLDPDQREVEQRLDRRLGQHRRSPPPSRAAIRPLLPSQRIDQRARLGDRDQLAEPAGGAEGQAEELELVGADLARSARAARSSACASPGLSRRRAARARWSARRPG